MTSEEEAGPLDALTTAVPEDTRDDDSRSRQEEEEKLILTAWQSMSSALRQHRLCEDVRGPGPAQSFLAEQRQSTRARRALPPPRCSPGRSLHPQGETEEVSPLTAMLGCKVVEEGVNFL